jgi:ATP-dependent exoDNAse (exonuclease V) beta subunit
MQSIYRFRDADVALFQRARRNGISTLRPAAIRIGANFRSSAPLVEWCNALFEGSLGDVEDPVIGQVAFARSMPIHDARPGDGCSVYGIVSADADRAEAGAVTQAVESIRNNHAGESVAILVRNRAHLTHLLPRLNDCAIPWTGADIHALAEQPVIDDLMTLLRAMSSSTNRIAWLALLRTPFVGMSLRDIETLAQFDETIAASIRDGMHDDALTDAGRARVQRIRPTLLKAERGRRQIPLRQWLENAFIRLGGTDAYDSAAIAHAQRLLALIEDTQGRSLDIAALERSVQRLFADTTPSDESVAIMTIHRAKGLEFDHVLVPGLHRVNRIDDPPPILWRPEGDRLLLGVRGSTAGDGVHRWLSHEERHRDANERIRLLYVAATRARRSLRLFGVLEEEDGEPQPPPARSLFAPIWRFARDRIEIVRSVDKSADETTATFSSQRRVVSTDYAWRPRKDPTRIDPL